MYGASATSAYWIDPSVRKPRMEVSNLTIVRRAALDGRGARNEGRRWSSARASRDHADERGWSSSEERSGPRWSSSEERAASPDHAHERGWSSSEERAASRDHGDDPDVSTDRSLTLAARRPGARERLTTGAPIFGPPPASASMTRSQPRPGQAPVAQRIEHLTTDQKVGSSNLSRRAEHQREPGVTTRRHLSELVRIGVGPPGPPSRTRSVAPSARGAPSHVPPCGYIGGVAPATKE